MKTNHAAAVFRFWLLVLAVAPLAAETLTYRESEGNTVATHVISITSDLAEPGRGFRVELVTTRAGAVVRQSFLIAADYSTLSWTFSDPARSMELAASRQGGKIFLTGHARGKKVSREFPGEGPAWNQLFQMGLTPLVGSGGSSFQFRSIGTQGPGEMKIGKFTAKRRETEKITLSGKEILAVHLRVSLSGLLSLFWHGDYWYRQSDGRFLRYRGKNRAGGPVAVSELLQEHGDDGR